MAIYIIINIVGSRNCRINVHTNSGSNRRGKSGSDEEMAEIYHVYIVCTGCYYIF